MKKILQLIWSFLLLAAVPFTASAQLSGTYTINGAVATGGTNYQTFTAAVSALSTQGVSGAVTFNVLAGTYTEQISIPAIAGASTTKTITFQGLGDLTTITAAPTSSNLPVISLDSASHIVFDSLKIEVTGTLGWGVHFMRHADTISVLNCHIVAPASGGIYGIVASGSTTALTVVQNNAEYIQIINNTIEGCDRSIQMEGKTGPLTVPSKQINYGTDINIVGNTMTNFSGKAVITNNYHNINIESNVMTTSNVDCNGAISVWDAGDNITITKNNIYVSSNAANTRVVVLAMAPPNGPAGDPTKPGIVANNMIQYDGTNSTGPTGLLLKNKSHIKVYNNTISIANQGTDANCIWLDANNTRALDGIEMRNNILALENSGSGYFIFNAANAASFDNMVLDHNNFYCANGYFKASIPNGVATSAVSYLTFTAYQSNTNGWGTGALNVDPGFVSATDLHATSGAMSDNAAVIAIVTQDIDGELRSTTTPDIGADEYMPPACITSNSLGAFNVLSTSADVYWTSYNTNGTFKVQYGLGGFTLGAGSNMLATNDTLALTGLSAQTAYDFYVLDYCSATDSSYWAGPYSFTTACGTVVTFPFIENFDASPWSSGSGGTNAGDVVDPCWTATPDGSSVTVYRWGTKSGPTTSTGTGPSSDASGSGNYIYTESSYGSSGDVAEFISPNLDLSSLSNPQLDFKYHMLGSTMGTLHVAIRGNGTEDTLASITDNIDSWQDMIVSLTGYSGIQNIVFYGVKGSSTSGDMAIDEFMLGEAPACPAPTFLSASNPTTNSIDIDFISSNNKFLIEYGPSGFNQGTGLIDTALVSGHTVTGLMSNTTYDFYIRTDCTDSLNGFSIWVGPVTLSTTCPVFNTFPYTETFDGLEWTAGTGSFSTGDEISSCWSRTPTDALSSVYRWSVRSGTTASSNTGPTTDISGNGNYMYTESSAGSTGANAFLTSPDFDLSQLNSAQLVFDYHMYGATMGDFYVEVSNGTITDTIAFVTGDQGNQWNNLVVNLGSSYSGVYHFTFIGVRGSSFTGDMAIDQVVVKEAPLCIAPTYMNASNITTDSLDLAWGGGDGTTWSIEYGLAGFAQGTGTMITGILDSTTTINGLMANTCYDFYVQSNCGSSLNSIWFGPITVCTPCATEMAPFAENFDAAPWASGSGSTNAGDEISSCWDRTPTAASAYRWSTRTGTTATTTTGPSSDVSGTGNYMFTEASSGSNGNVAYLSLPTIDFTALTQPTLSFKYHMYGAAMGELFITILNGTTWDTVYSIAGQQQSATTDPFKTVYVDLTTYKSVPREIRIGAKRGPGFNSDMAIDEVSVAELPSCLPPSNFSLGTVTSTSAGFSWSSLTGGPNFMIEYGPTGFTQGTGGANKTNFSSLSGTLTGLAVNTTFDAYLTDKCDSTIWLGPITFTTLIDFDAELKNIVSPISGSCGDSTYSVVVVVKNNGLNAITSLPVYATITGSATGSINTTYTGNIAPGATASIIVGTINTYFGGLVNVMAYTGLTTDQNTANDSLSSMNIELISGEPLHMPVDTLCANDTTGMFVAIPQTGITHNWYVNATDTVPVATGDTIAAMPGQTVYLDRSKSVDETILDAQNTSSQYGNMFKLYIKESFLFTGFSFEAATSGNGMPIAFYKSGNFLGHEATRSDWTPIDSLSMTVVSNGWYRLDFTNPVQFTAGDTVSIYIANKLGTKMRWETIPQATAVGDLYLANGDFEYYVGVTGAYFGTNMIGVSPRAVSSILHYSSNQICGNNRIALTMGVNNDTAMASFTAVVNANGTDVDFDASASSGHVYNWNFGDGNTGTGMTTTNTYVNNGTYTVTLIVTDTVCGTTDTTSQTVFISFGIDESLLGRSLKVFPNPNNGTFRVSFELEGIQEIELAVVSTVGQVIYQENLGSVAGRFETELAIENLATGVYFLRVMANGKPTTIKISIL